jgi:hypothetical protein
VNPPVRKQNLFLNLSALALPISLRQDWSILIGLGPLPTDHLALASFSGKKGWGFEYRKKTGG